MHPVENAARPRELGDAALFVAREAPLGQLALALLDGVLRGLLAQSLLELYALPLRDDGLLAQAQRLRLRLAAESLQPEDGFFLKLKRSLNVYIYDVETSFDFFRFSLFGLFLTVTF